MNTDTRVKFRPRCAPIVTFVHGAQFFRDEVLIRVSDGVLTTATPFPSEAIYDCGEDTVISLVRDMHAGQWQKIIEPRALRMRIAYDQRRRARKRRR